MIDNYYILQKIKKVDAPERLYEDILLKIEHQKSLKNSNKWIYAIAASVLVILFLDVYVIASKFESKKNDLENVKDFFVESNQLYYE
jgi:hypothetical protein